MRDIKPIRRIRRGSSYYDLFADGCIAQAEHAPSGEWKIAGAVTLNNFGNIVRRFTLQEILDNPASIPWQHGNGKQKTFLLDWDHGINHMWGGTATQEVYAASLS